ncbi:hypothetical protein F5Y03DRAFT_390143 [Xylaria venustula]|nr:hypothetical protein F5Y03DRAFT_390143 [Xylaria venustula]
MSRHGDSTEPIPTLRDLSNTFVLSSSGPGSGQVLSEVPKFLSLHDPSRQRRAHLKSKAGCDNCRRRRVKCSDEIPCTNCTRRGDHCQRRAVRPTSVSSIPKISTQFPSSNSRSADTAVNLLHMKMFHHFQTSTRQTLLWGEEAWDHVLQLSFEFDYLMNAILCIAARHLSVVRPNDLTYRTMAVSQLCRASSGLRKELSRGGVSIHLDSFLATSMLLYYDTWTNADYFSASQDDGIASDVWTDRVFGFSSSLKRTLLACFQRLWEKPSILRQAIMKNPLDELTAVLNTSPDKLAEYEDFFSYHRPIDMLSEPLENLIGKKQTSLKPGCVYRHQIAPDPAEEAYAPVARRLCVILPLVIRDQSQDLTRNPVPSSLMPLLARFILSFPLLGFSAFPTLVDRGDSHALFLLYHFYRAVRILLSREDWWWAHRRAVAAEGVLRERLIGTIQNRCTTQYKDI